MRLEDISEAISEVIDSAMNSVVTISTVRIALDALFGLAPVKGVGSGFIIDERGFIVTNNHVIQGASKVMVILPGGESIDGEVIAGDPYRDLALVKISIGGLKPIRMGDSDKIRVGEIVFALGSPLGLPGPTVTMGVVSAVGRTIAAEDIVLEDLIQTDAAINPGNSGGPLINASGEAIGVTTAIVPFAQGIGFAIPINTVRRFLEMVSRFGRSVMAFIGVYVAPLTSKTARAVRFPVSNGLVVVGVVRGGPAYRVGIRRGDIIVRANGKDLYRVSDLRTIVEESVDKGYVELEIYRDGRTYRVEVPIVVEEVE